MKKFYLCLLLIALLVLSSCAPKDIGKDHYTAGIKAVGIVDSFLDSKMTGLDANKKMVDIYAQIESIEGGKDVLSKDFAVQSAILSVNLTIGGVSVGTATNEDVLKDRNALADILGKGER